MGARTELMVRAGAMEKTSYIRTGSVVTLAVRESLGSTGEASVEWEWRLRSSRKSGGGCCCISLSSGSSVLGDGEDAVWGRRVLQWGT